MWAVYEDALGKIYDDVRFRMDDIDDGLWTNVKWEGCGMDVVIRLIDPEDELADFLYQCDDYYENETYPIGCTTKGI